MSDDFVRDMPVDYTLLVENLVDPDHGLFAHQTPTFDSFAASTDHPMSVQSEPGRTADKVGVILPCAFVLEGQLAQEWGSLGLEA